MTWHLLPRFMLRVGGLPFDTAAALATPASATWADDVLDARQRLRERGARLADSLQERVARSFDDPAARRTLINLRRDVFNARAPRGLTAAEPLLPTDELTELRAWSADRQRLEELLRTGSGILSEEITAAREELRRVAIETDLRYGIQLSSPSLDEYLDDYLRRADGPLSKRERRIERSLLEYLLRTACKTSPFSTLTAVSAGVFAEADGRPLAASVRGWDKRGSTRLNIALLARLSELLTGDPQVRRDLPVRATSGTQIHRDQVRYLRKLRGADGNADAAVTLDAVHESLFFLPSGEALADVLALFGDGMTLRFGDAVRQLCAMDTTRSEQEVERYLAQLLRLGLLVVPDLHIDIHDPDPVATYRRGLLRLGADWADDTAALVERMGSDVERFADAEVRRRRELLAQIKESVAQTHRLLGRDDTPVLRTLVYEDTTLPGLAVTGDASTWSRQLTPGLQQLARILPAFDGNLVRRIVTKGFFRARYGEGGRCEDFLSFAHQFNQDFYNNYNKRLMRHQRFDGTDFRTYDNWFRQEEIAAIDRARAAVAQEMSLRYRTASATDADIELDEDFLAAVEGLLPRPERLRSLSFFLQLAENGAEDPLVIVNRIYSGLTLLFSRFAHSLDEGLTASLRQALDDVVPKGAVFAELKGGYDATNLNLHPVVTPYEVVCPGETSFRPPHQQIPVEDLVIEHEAATDRLLLRSRRLGVEVIPVYLGFLLPMALPEVQQVLLNFSCTTMVQLDVWEGTGIPKGRSGALPRVRLGNVVLQRKSWRFAADRLPPVTAGQSDQEWFLAWREWQRTAGLPRHVFASLGGERKPQYVDFDSYACVRLLETAVRKSDSAVTLTEMLPGPDQLWLRDDRHRYVTELTVELNGHNATDTER
ncbi:lantibiotic dehydratase [Streptomyces chiangmaiensis]|uniref:Lantibiotic dehydratase n=1 Tax=Streptomyces chiangmaiensis TaxID=766497 RepID=A0ABU7FIH8_9ACTN|nr:lantibiotic dehydratase [Streptomyces chiangmaiensis]MED7823744.1 lantibiotic dehydratase [Streptomyces chiangmaiensis]